MVKLFSMGIGLRNVEQGHFKDGTKYLRQKKTKTQNIISIVDYSFNSRNFLCENVCPNHSTTVI